MPDYGAAYADSNYLSADSHREAAHELASLRLLICDLLKTNQELRGALLKARLDGPLSQSSEPSASSVGDSCNHPHATGASQGVEAIR